MDETILVVGGTGRLGEPVARRLYQEGFLVRILSRNPLKVRGRFEGFEVIEGDVEYPETLRPALEGCQGVHISLAGGPRPEDYERIEHHGTANVVTAAVKQGLKRITYISGATVAPDNAWFEGTRAKLAAEEAIQRSGIPYTIFRCAWFMESLPLFVRGKRASTIGRQPHPVHWLAAEDYATMVTRAYRTSEAENQTFTVFGPEAMTLGEGLRRYCALVHPEVKTGTTPVWLMKLIARLLGNAELLNTVRTLAYLDRVAEQGDPTEANRLLGAPTTTLEKWSTARIHSAVPVS